MISSQIQQLVNITCDTPTTPSLTHHIRMAHYVFHQTIFSLPEQIGCHPNRMDKVSMMSIDMSTLDTVGDPMEVDKSVEAGVTQPTEIEEDDSLLGSGTIPSSHYEYLTPPHSHLCRGTPARYTFQPISDDDDAPSIHLPLLDPPSIPPCVMCPVLLYSIIAVTAYPNSQAACVPCKESCSAHPALFHKTNLCQFLRSNAPSSPRQGTVRCITLGLLLHRKYISIHPPQIPAYYISGDC